MGESALAEQANNVASVNEFDEDDGAINWGAVIAAEQELPLTEQANKATSGNIAQAKKATSGNIARVGEFGEDDDAINWGAVVAAEQEFVNSAAAASGTPQKCLSSLLPHIQELVGPRTPLSVRTSVALRGVCVYTAQCARTTTHTSTRTHAHKYTHAQGVKSVTSTASVKRKRKRKRTPAKTNASEPHAARARATEPRAKRRSRQVARALGGLGDALGGFNSFFLHKVVPFIRSPRALLSVAGACRASRQTVKDFLSGSRGSFENVLRVIYFWRLHKRPSRVAAVMKLYVEGKIFRPCPLRLLRLELAKRCESADAHIHIHIYIVYIYVHIHIHKYL